MKIDQPPVFIIFGVSGDLSKRKLLPALYDLLDSGILPEETKIYGTSRRELQIDDVLSSVDIQAFSDNKVDEDDARAKFKQFLSFVQVDPDKDEDYQKLSSLLDQLDSDQKRLRLYYMSIPSSAYEPIIKKLAEHHMNDDRSRLMIEKPFGHDLKSAIQSIEVAHEAFPENQIYRIDHYLAKDMSQNLINFRANNSIYGDLWNNLSIESVEITQHETLGVEGRADFYEQTGALRDVVQNHLMQLLAITMMDQTNHMTSDNLHKAKLEFFEGLDEADPSLSVRKQYKKYKEEVGNPKSEVETFAKVILTSHQDKWKGIKFILEHGKSMPKSFASVTVNFKQHDNHDKQQLIFEIQPDEKILEVLEVKVPGLENEAKSSEMSIDFKKSFPDNKSYDAYAKVMVDSIVGDQSLFASDDEVTTTWKVMQPILDDWQNHTVELEKY
jgi:glucose-6-phosphate 1-dehydrogenase